MDSTAHQSSDRLNSSINVNLPIAYLLYFFGGIFGLHHAYLNRPNQGLAWYATCGLFGFGLLRDLYRIPTYVSLCRDDRTNDVAARVRAATIVAREGVPKLSLGRVILMVVFGTYFGFVASCLVALPRYEGEEEAAFVFYVYGLLRTMGAAIGIWLVGNMGEEMIQTIPTHKNQQNDGSDRIIPDERSHQKGEFRGLATYCTASWVMLNRPILGGIIYAVKRRRYRPTMSPGQTIDGRSSSATRRIARHLLNCALFTAVLTIAVCNHGSVNVNGNKVYLQDAIRNAINSGFWKESFDWEQFHSSSSGGSEYLKKTFDITGERAARRTLGVATDATHAEVRSAYKKLALKYHPDKIGSDATDKEVKEANRKFNKVQEAYEVLNDIEQARKKKERETTTESPFQNSSNNSGGRRPDKYRKEEM